MLVSVLVRIWLASKITTPWIMVDELLYSDLAKSIETSGHFLIRNVPAGPRTLYAVLIAPAWAAHSMSTTYALAKAINVVLMTAAAVPVYLWARRLMPRLYAVVVVGLVLLLPSFFYAGSLMTENAFFPAVVVATFAMALALEKPTIVRQVLALAAVALAAAVRIQAIVLVLVFLSAIVLLAVLELRAYERERRRRSLLEQLRPFWPTAALLAIGLLGYVAFKVAQGQPLRSGLGSYQPALTGRFTTSPSCRSRSASCRQALSSSCSDSPSGGPAAGAGRNVPSWP